MFVFGYNVFYIFVNQKYYAILMILLLTNIVKMVTSVSTIPEHFHILTSHNTNTCHAYFFISCSSSSKFPVLLRVRTFQVPKVALLRSLIIFMSFFLSVAYFYNRPDYLRYARSFFYLWRRLSRYG